MCSLSLSLYQRDDKGFAHPERIQKLVKNYSQFVSFPIYTWQEKGFTKEVWLSVPYPLFHCMIYATYSH
jgi:HSP90 family molecular chaperone